MKQIYFIAIIGLIFNAFPKTVARKHHVLVPNDTRPYIALSTFGFYMGGQLDVKLNKLYIENENPNDVIGFSLDKTTIDQMTPYLDSHQTRCLLEDPNAGTQNGPIIFFRLDLKNDKVHVQCSNEWHNMYISQNRPKRLTARVSDSTLFMQRRRRRDLAPVDESDHGLPVDENVNIEQSEESYEQPMKPTKSSVVKTVSAAVAPDAPALAAIANKTISNVGAAVLPVQQSSEAVKSQTAQKPVASIVQDSAEPTLAPSVNYQSKEIKDICAGYSWDLIKTVENGKNYYSTSLYMQVLHLADEGLYNLYFHACPNYREEKPVTFSIDIEEKNRSNYLSAGEMPLPALYFMMSLLFFLSGLFWVFILKKSKHTVYKIHYIMAVLVFLKSLSLLFHAINYHFIDTRGEHVEAWAILYYITHLLKGAVLFITIVLIGTGWTFIKHILSDKDKKIFMIVIPLQILANVAEIILDESEESDIEFRTWRNIFIFVDLICCGAILFPIVWSIRHLHEASATDGKAAINLKKLKLFRQFYIMIVCYIYFTRIIVYLLKMTVAFQYAWLDEMFHEMATYVFFVLTGYKFRPASSHPYFQVPDEDDDQVEVITESGLTQGVYRTKAQNRGANSKPTTVVIEGNDEERENLLTNMDLIKRESSHEYD